MSNESSTPNYVYKGIVQGRTRLLKILSVVGENVNCSFEDCSLDAPPTYSALSYAWGVEPRDHYILCDGERLAVTPHLHEGLRCIGASLAGSESYLWCDAICINQQDSEEKAFQVSQMHNIYRKAEGIVVWLGKSEYNSDMAIDSIERLYDIVTKLPQMLHDDRMYAEYGLPLKSDPIWPAILKFYNRSWIQRLWVVQEVARAQQINLWCGMRKLNWQTYSRFGLRLRTANIAVPMVAELDPVWPKLGSQVEGFNALIGNINIRRLWMENRNAVFQEALNFGRSRQVKEPIDRIYALLGLAEGSNQIYREQIPVDYSAESRANFWRPYVQCSRIDAKHEPGLTVLRQSSSKVRPPGYPSWCPNYNSIRETFLMSHRYKAGGGPPIPFQVKSEDAKQGDVWNNPYVELPDNNENAIAITGAQVDEVEEVLPHISFHGWSKKENHEPPNSMSAKLLEWLDRYSERIVELCKESGYNNPADMYWRSLVGDLDRDEDGDEWFPAEDDSGYNHNCAIRWLEEIKDGIPERSFLNVWDHRTAEAYLNQISNLWQERSFFVTKTHRVGFGVKRVRAGDRLCVFHTGPTAYLLRKRKTGHNYEFISDAYLHGVMNGEALELIRSGELKEEKFVLD